MEGCSKAGGTWIDPKAFATLGLADWSPDANAQVAKIAQQLGTVTTTITVNGSTAPVPTLVDALSDSLGSTAPGLIGNGLKVMIFAPDNMPDPYRLFTTRYCGGGGGGQTTVALDKACKTHDECFDAAGLSARSNGAGTTLTLAQALAAQDCNQALYDFARSHPNEPGSKALQYWLTKGAMRPFGHLAPGTEAFHGKEATYIPSNCCSVVLRSDAAVRCG